MTPLCLACWFKAWDSALLLLSRGADPNKAAKWIGGDVYTPLLLAAYLGSIEVCKSLLASGARLDIDTGGEEHGRPNSKMIEIIIIER